MLERQNDLPRIESGLFLGESVPFGNEAVEVSSRAVLENKVQSLGRLETADHLDDEGMVDFRENLLFDKHIVLLLLLENLLFVNDFHGVGDSRAQLFDEHDPGEGSFADEAERGEVFQDYSISNFGH